MRRLIVMDVDSTFISQEQIDLLAALACTGEQVAEITERAMRGELDFEASLRARVATLAGLADTAFEEVRGQISFTPGALELVEHCAEHGWPLALVSGGIHEIIDPLIAHPPITHVPANRPAVAGRLLTGEDRCDGVHRADHA